MISAAALFLTINACQWVFSAINFPITRITLMVMIVSSGAALSVLSPLGVRTPEKITNFSLIVLSILLGCWITTGNYPVLFWGMRTRQLVTEAMIVYEVVALLVLFVPKRCIFQQNGSLHGASAVCAVILTASLSCSIGLDLGAFRKADFSSSLYVPIRY